MKVALKAEPRADARVDLMVAAKAVPMVGKQVDSLAALLAASRV